MKRLCVALTLLVFAAGLSQNKQLRQDELSTEVPALTKYHVVIYKLWHTAWPEKSATMLVDLLPEVEQGANEIANAALPGILRDKNVRWSKGVKDLLSAVASYRSAASPLDETKLLDAAERLHMQYEKLVRIIRPVLTELEAIHATIYIIYHFALPEGNLDQLRSLSAELPAKMAALNSAILPDRLKARTDEFTTARMALSKSVGVLVAAAPKGSLNDLKPLVHSMHADYENLENMFE